MRQPLPPTVNDHLPCLVARLRCGCAIDSMGPYRVSERELQNWRTFAARHGWTVEETTVGAFRAAGGVLPCDHAHPMAQQLRLEGLR